MQPNHLLNIIIAIVNRGLRELFYKLSVLFIASDKRFEKLKRYRSLEKCGNSKFVQMNGY